MSSSVAGVSSAAAHALAAGSAAEDLAGCKEGVGAAVLLIAAQEDTIWMPQRQPGARYGGGGVRRLSYSVMT